MLSGMFKDRNPHELAWMSSNWDKVDELIKDYSGIEKTNFFDIIEQITFSKKPITPEQLSIYNKWMINNALSQNVDCLFFVDQMNMFGEKLTNEQHYNYYMLSIRKNKRYSKWAKVEYDIETEIYKLLLAKRFCINLKDAEVYYSTLLRNGKLKDIELKHLVDSVDFSIVKTAQDKKILKGIVEGLQK